MAWERAKVLYGYMNRRSLESYGSLLRRMAKMKPDERAAVEKYLVDLFAKLEKVFPGMG